MRRLLSSIRKELILLLRDRGGLAILFLMPVALITIMALIQDAPFRDYQELKIPLLLVNNDTGKIGQSLKNGLKESKIFEITELKTDEKTVKEKVKSEQYEVGIIIPDQATDRLNSKVSNFVTGKLAEAGLPGAPATPSTIDTSVLNIVVLFAPETKKSFRASILGSLKQSASKAENQTLIEIFSKKLNIGTGTAAKSVPLKDFITFTEPNTVATPKEALLLNSVQHNVPAWTIFGMFFIVISLAGSLIKEREEGIYTRILVMPGSTAVLLSGKIAAYLFICLIQCVLMLLVGMYLLPHLGLPSLVIGHNIAAIGVVAICTGLAATGYGILVGTIFTTHQQASTFGAVSVVILAALGGIWVPVYVMPDAIRIFTKFSPLYWALTAFHKVFLGQGDITSILPYALKLIGLFISCLLASFLYNKNKLK